MNDRVTPRGQAMGKNAARLAGLGLARLAAQGLGQLEGPGSRKYMCKSCACRPGTVPNGCHNRAPFLTVVSLRGGHSFPFRMATDCQYTLSALGQADPRCAGCRWRASGEQSPSTTNLPTS